MNFEFDLADVVKIGIMLADLAHKIWTRKNHKQENSEKQKTDENPKMS